MAKRDQFCQECGMRSHVPLCSRECVLRAQDRSREECPVTWLNANTGEAVLYTHGFPAPPGRRPVRLDPEGADA